MIDYPALHASHGGIWIATAPGGTRTVGRGEAPLGLLTHHLVQDARTWAFCAALLERLRAHPAVRVARADGLFAPEASPVSQTGARVPPV